MKNLSNLINDIYKLDFTSNTFADKGHEGSVESILKENGLIEVDNSSPEFTFLREKDNSSKMVNDLQGKFLYVKQPFGSQSAPDFIICIDGFVLWIECKSSSRGKITWNTGFPRKDILFIFSSKSKKQTTIFLGQDHPDYFEGFEKYYVEFVQSKRQEISNEYKNKFNPKKSSFYLRPMWNDSTDYSDIDLRNYFFESVKLKFNI